MKNLSEKILTEIKSRKMKPIPRWLFVAKKTGIIALAFTTTTLASVGFAAIIHSLLNRDWFVYRETHLPFFDRLLLDLPYLWLLFLILMLVLIYLNVHSFENGYRYSVFMIILGSLLISITAGAVFSTVGFGRQIDEIVDQTLPFYTSSNEQNTNIWSRPKDGLLGGKIVRQDENNFELQDFHNNLWLIESSNQEVSTIEKKLLGQQVKIIGKEKENCACFLADKILPWPSN